MTKEKGDEIEKKHSNVIDYGLFTSSLSLIGAIALLALYISAT